MKRFSNLLAATSVLCLSATAHATPTNIMFILDGSGSMWGQIDSVAKIETAKQTMIKLMDDLPTDAKVGLMTYGTKDKKSCQDVTQLSPVGADREAIKAGIKNLTPLGKTPIELALRKGIANLAVQASGQHKSLVLISDGIETCDGSPCNVAKTAKLPGLEMKVHVVGYDVDAEARAQLECIAAAGEGKYFNASDTNGFKDAIEQVVQVAQAKPEPVAEPEPIVEEPKGPTITEFFRDDFDGEELAEHWAIENPNPDNFIVEDGILTMLSTSEGGFEVEKPENLISYTGEMPKGDWDAVITFTGDYAPARDRLSFGLRKDAKSYLSSSYSAQYFSAANCHSTWAALNRASKGKNEDIKSYFRSTKNTHCRAAEGQYDKTWDEMRAAHQENPIKLTFSKRGRAYTASVEMAGYQNKEGKPIIATTDQFTSLRAAGTLSFNIERFESWQVQGEVLMNIDSVVINKVEQ